MQILTFRKYLQETSGHATIEFVAIFLGLIAVVFFILEMVLYMFFTATLEKAAQAGVRAAITSTPLVEGVPARNVRTSTGTFGVPCSDASSPCVSYSTVSCTGESCAQGSFADLLAHVQSISGLVEASHITVTYSDVGLGYAGGISVPMVSVTLSGVPYETGVLSLLLQNAGVLDALPDRSASMTGEDLNT